MNNFNSLKYNKFIANLANKYYKAKCKNLKQIIFTATTGRSGTLTLVDIFNNIPGCLAEHEPYPAMFDEVSVAKSNGNEKFVRDTYFLNKSINLKRAAASYQYYFESNHMFIKTYIEYAIEDFGPKASVIHLVRDPLKVANSIYSLQDFPGTIEGNKWWLDYRANNNHINLSEQLDNDTEFRHPFYKGLWYWYEIESRVKYWKKKLPQVRFFDFRTEDFNDRPKTFKLLKDIGIEFDEEHLSTKINTRSNSRPHQKIVTPLSLKTAQDKLERFKQLLDEKGMR